MTAVNDAIGSRTDLSFDGTTLTYTGDGNPMADLVINLTATADSQVEADEDYQVVLSSPGTTTVSDITLGTSEVTTTITSADPASWSITGDTTVREGSAANYTVHLSGTLQAGETATIDLAITDLNTTSADYTNFVAAVKCAIGQRVPLCSDLSYTGTC